MTVTLFVVLPMGYAIGLLVIGPTLADVLDRWRDGPMVAHGVKLVHFDAFLKDRYR